MIDAKRGPGRPPNPPAPPANLKRVPIYKATFKEGVQLPDGSTRITVCLDSQIGKVDKITWLPEWQAVEILSGAKTTYVGYGAGVTLVPVSVPVEMKDE